MTENCVMGLKICSDDTACPMHAKWKPIKLRIVELLHKQTLGKLAVAVKSGKYRLAELPHAALSPPTSVSHGAERNRDDA